LSATSTACRAKHHAGVAREILVTGDSAERETEIDARRDAMLVVHDNGLKADVIGVFQRADQSRAIKGDVELARQSVQRAIVEDVMMHGARIGTRIDELLRIDAGGRRPGDVADCRREPCSTAGSGSLQNFVAFLARFRGSGY
jgi:hypothetical protein